MSWEDHDSLRELVGTQVREVWWSEDRISFVTDAGTFSYEVEGDCCSRSVFHDLIGLDKLLAGPVTDWKEVPLSDEEYREWQARVGRCLKAKDGYAPDGLAHYGFQIFTLHPQYGEVTTALSFRNESNGYYGGWMKPSGITGIVAGQRKLDSDVIFPVDVVEGEKVHERRSIGG